MIGDIEEYFTLLKSLAEESYRNFRGAHFFIEYKIKSDKGVIDMLIDFRKNLISQNEIDKVSPFLRIYGYFSQYHNDDRIACFVVNDDLTDIIRRLEWRTRCEKYNPGLLLFQKAPILFSFIRRKDNGSYDNELLAFSAFRQVNGSEVLEFNGGYTVMDFVLNPAIVTWAGETFQNSEIFIRADANFYSPTQPPYRLDEEIEIPANPNWWQNLKLHNRNKEGASYFIPEIEPCEETKNAYWDRYIKGVLKLEVIAKRNNKGNLTMMVEEVCDIKDGLMICRCIHLDTDSPYGTPFEEANLNHLDLAINIYEDEAAVKRISENLASGKVTTNATYRTHLLRVNNIQFKGLLGFARFFLKSKTLFNEWLNDQFIDLDFQ